MVVYGDNFLEIDFRDFIEYSEIKDGIGTVAVFEKENVLGSGILDFDDNCEVVSFKEKPNEEEVFSHWISAGVFYFRKEIFNFIQPGFSDFGFDVLPKILESKEKLYAYKLKGGVWGIDSPVLLNELINQRSKIGNRETKDEVRKS